MIRGLIRAAINARLRNYCGRTRWNCSSALQENVGAEKDRTTTDTIKSETCRSESESLVVRERKPDVSASSPEGDGKAVVIDGRRLPAIFSAYQKVLKVSGGGLLLVENSAPVVKDEKLNSWQVEPVGNFLVERGAYEHNAYYLCEKYGRTEMDPALTKLVAKYASMDSKPLFPQFRWIMVLAKAEYFDEDSAHYHLDGSRKKFSIRSVVPHVMLVLHRDQDEFRTPELADEMRRYMKQTATRLQPKIEPVVQQKAVSRAYLLHNTDRTAFEEEHDVGGRVFTRASTLWALFSHDIGTSSPKWREARKKEAESKSQKEEPSSSSIQRQPSSKSKYSFFSRSHPRTFTPTKGKDF